MSAWVVKLIILGLIDVLGIWAVVKAAAAPWWLAVGFLVVVLVAVNIVYFRRGGLPFKYLLPGLVFLIAFQLYPAGYTFGASFTNYGTGHLLPQSQVVTAILGQNTRPVEGAPSYQVVPVQKGGQVSMLITDPTKPNTAYLGTNESKDPATDAGVLRRQGDWIAGLHHAELGQPQLRSTGQGAVGRARSRRMRPRASSSARSTAALNSARPKSARPTSTTRTTTPSPVPTTARCSKANGAVGLYTSPDFEDAKKQTAANDGKYLTPGWSVFVGPTTTPASSPTRPSAPTSSRSCCGPSPSRSAPCSCSSCSAWCWRW